MKTAAQIVHEFVLDRIAGESLARQIELYGALADLSPTPSEAREYRALKKELQNVQRRHRQLVLDFKRATRGKPTGNGQDGAHDGDGQKA